MGRRRDVAARWCDCSADHTIIDVLPPLPLNTVLILAGTLHGIHAITSKLTPSQQTGSAGGMEAFEAENWGGRVFLTPTGGSYLLSFGSLKSPRDALMP